MAFWLARERRAQESTFMQRFDPRFWTVNFPRPMMASVITTAPDALRVDATFLREGDLAADATQVAQRGQLYPISPHIACGTKCQHCVFALGPRGSTVG